MRFSVIVPLYNKAPYVEKALRSVFAQTFRDYELIVVDDGSTDGSFDLAKEVIDARCTMHDARLLHQENMGVGAARNNGVAASKGDYLCFLDADDWWEPTFLEEMDRMIASLPDAGIYGTSYYLVKHGKKRIAPIEPVNIESQQVDESTSQQVAVEKQPSANGQWPTANAAAGLINYLQTYAKTLCMPLWTGAVGMSRSVFDEFGGFRQHLKLGEDFDLWIKVALKYPVAFMDKPLSNYNQDVDVTYRGTHHLHDPKFSMLWNLEYLEPLEQTNPDYKQLIDRLRTYGLFPYYLSRQYHEAAAQELAKVDWSKQTDKWQRLYQRPLWYLNLRESVLRVGSLAKSKIKSVRG